MQVLFWIYITVGWNDFQNWYFTHLGTIIHYSDLGWIKFQRKRLFFQKWFFLALLNFTHNIKWHLRDLGKVKHDSSYILLRVKRDLAYDQRRAIVNCVDFNEPQGLNSVFRLRILNNVGKQKQHKYAVNLVMTLDLTKRRLERRTEKWWRLKSYKPTLA